MNILRYQGYCKFHFSVHDTKLFYWLIRKSFHSDEKWRLFYCNSILGCQVIQNLDLCKLDELSCHDVHRKWCKILVQNIEYPWKYEVYRVDVLQGWCTARTTHCDSGYDVTMATSTIADLYLPKTKNALFAAPESNGLSCTCAV